MNLPFFEVIKGLLDNNKKSNQEDPNVKTADHSIFDRLTERAQKKRQFACDN